MTVINWWIEITQLLCIATPQPTDPTENMCKARPTTNNNNGEEISSSNTAVGLINFSAEEWSLSKPHHRTEIITSLLLVILILFGVYKLRQRCIKKRNNNLNRVEPAPNPHYNLNILPNQPPTSAHDYLQAKPYPHNPTYESAQPKSNPPQQPMPYSLMATLGQKDTKHSE